MGNRIAVKKFGSDFFGGGFPDVFICHGDLPVEFHREMAGDAAISIDIETTGLDYRTDEIGSIQVFSGGDFVYVLRPPFDNMPLLGSVLADEERLKIFHHAMFDLRFLRQKFNFKLANIACTKIAAKIVQSESDSYSLGPLLEYYFELRLDKSMQVSDWLRDGLSPRQVKYAVKDVIYLPMLLRELLNEADRKSRMNLVNSSFMYLPARVDLDLLGINDVYLY